LEIPGKVGGKISGANHPSPAKPDFYFTPPGDSEIFLYRAAAGDCPKTFVKTPLLSLRICFHLRYRTTP
jgi:hypothetical protein